MKMIVEILVDNAEELDVTLQVMNSHWGPGYRFLSYIKEFGRSL